MGYGLMGERKEVKGYRLIVIGEEKRSDSCPFVVQILWMGKRRWNFDFGRVDGFGWEARGG